MSKTNEFDLLVIGGGVMGAGVARDAQGRGLKVCLVEQNDLGSGTSSASSKLFHGGLRYLETYEFSLVRQALKERETLLRAMPHIAWPLTFYLPHTPEQRPAWLIRLGLILYDNLAKRQLLPGSGRHKLAQTPFATWLNPRWKSLFSYADVWVQDARLVLLNAKDAVEHGATLLTYTRVTQAQREAEGWRIEVESQDGKTRSLSAKALVNAAGPWLSQVEGQVLQRNRPTRLRLVKGSHLVLNRAMPRDTALILQNSDGRVVFALPFEEDLTLLGTTDVEIQGDPGEVSCSPEEEAYLLEVAARFFAEPPRPDEVLHRMAGVRPLQDDGDASASKVSRDYQVVREAPEGAAPLVSIYGGKLTAFREVSAEVVDALAADFNLQPAWTHTSKPLPGGDMEVGAEAFDTACADLEAAYPFVPAATLRRYLRNYGTRTHNLLQGTKSLDDLGQDFGAGLYAVEMDYVVREEFVRHADDFLWRRTKLGIRLDAKARQAVAAHIEQARKTHG